MEFATYQIIPEQNGNGTYFFTDCGHWMFSIRDGQLNRDNCIEVFLGRGVSFYLL